jgi:hypothetical protein
MGMSDFTKRGNIERRWLSLAAAALLLAAGLVLAGPRAARADVTVKLHDTIYGSDLVLIANSNQGGKQAEIGIAKDNNSPVILFGNYAIWSQFVALWNRAKSAPASDQKQKIGTFIDQSSGNVMGIDVGKDGIFFFITDTDSTQLFVLKKADQGTFDDDVQNVTLFLTH